MTESPAAGDDARRNRTSRDSPRSSRDSLGGLVRLPRFDRRGRWLLVALVAVAWAATSIYKVQPDEQGVVLRFGKWVDTTEPGCISICPTRSRPCCFPR